MSSIRNHKTMQIYFQFRWDKVTLKTTVDSLWEWSRATQQMKTQENPTKVDKESESATVDNKERTEQASNQEGSKASFICRIELCAQVLRKPI